MENPLLRFVAAVLGAGALLLAGCRGEPIVARSPDALLARAKEQLAHSSFRPAADTLARVLEQSPEGELAARAHVLRLVLLGGMARGYKQMGESFLEGYEKAGTAPYASGLRAIAMDYFGRSRGRSIEMVEGLDRLLRERPASPLPLDLPMPVVAAERIVTVEKVRGGRQIAEQEQATAEDEEIRQGMAVLMAGLLGAGKDVEKARAGYAGTATLELDAFYLAMAEEIVEASDIYRREALGDPRLFRLYHERAAGLAEQAARLAQERGHAGVRKRAGELQQRCQKILSAR